VIFTVYVMKLETVIEAELKKSAELMKEVKLGLESII